MADHVEADFHTPKVRAEDLRRLRVLVGVAGYVAAVGTVLRLAVGYVPLSDSIGMDGAFFAFAAAGSIMMFASLTVLVGLLLQWLWLQRPGQPGSLPLLVGLLLPWGWLRLDQSVDLWGFQSYDGDLVWSNPDIRNLLLLAAAVTFLVFAVGVSALILGSRQMLHANRTPDGASGQTEVAP
jgi:hypothetical protein